MRGPRRGGCGGGLRAEGASAGEAGVGGSGGAGGGRPAWRAAITGLPVAAPDDPVTVIAAECDAEPSVDGDYVREHRERYKVGVSWS